jgi:hypothetical protein
VAVLEGAQRRGATGRLHLGGAVLTVRRVVGVGAYAAVYLADQAEGRGAIALKWQSPPCPWEW